MYYINKMVPMSIIGEMLRNNTRYRIDITDYELKMQMNKMKNMKYHNVGKAYLVYMKYKIKCMLSESISFSFFFLFSAM